MSWLQKSVFSVSRRTTAITWNTSLLQTNHILYWNISQIIQLWCYLFSQIWYPFVFISVSVETNLHRDNIHNICELQNQIFLCFVDCAYLYNLANKSKKVHNSAQYIYFSSLHVSGNHVPIIRRNYCIYATLVFVTLYGWCLVCWLEFHSNQQTRRHPYRVTNTSVA